MTDTQQVAPSPVTPAHPQAPAALRYLPAVDLEKCLPDIPQRLDLAARALVALARGEAEMPPKIGVHPRPGALLHAMPAWLRGDDVVGLKWVSAFPENRRRGLPAIGGLVVLNDPDTGIPTWIMGAGRITAVRTAAVSGVAMRLLAPASVSVVAVLGAGVQARSHLEMVGSLLPAARARIFGPHAEHAAALAAEQNEVRGERWVEPASSAREAVDGAEVVITVATLGATTERITADRLRPGTLVVAVDFATYVDADVARRARPFVTDDREQFLHYGSLGYFDGYPEPATMLGELAADWPDRGEQPEPSDTAAPALVTHLGVGIADVLFANAICREAERQGAGVELPR